MTAFYWPPPIADSLTHLNPKSFEMTNANNAVPIPASDEQTEANVANPVTLRAEPPDPFDPSSLRLGADFSEGLGVRKVISTIPCRKPSKSEWFQVRPGDDWRLQTAVLEVENGVDRATYLVQQRLWADLHGEITPALVMTCVNRNGDLFLWRIKLPGPDGRSNTWTESALRIAEAAETTWCRMVADTSNGHYTHYEPTAGLPEPKWPELAFRDVLKIAFRDRFIETIDHPVLRQLRGAV